MITNLRRTFTTTNFKRQQIPWYLRPESNPTINSPLNKEIIPELPNNSPIELKNIVNHLVKELGLKDLNIYNMDENNANEGSISLGNFMIIGTGKSQRHLQKASDELKFLLKHEYHLLSHIEGLVNSNALARYHRRLQRKGKAANYSKNDYGAMSNSWIMCDCQNGIVVHMLTEDRRKEVNLEELWGDKKKWENSNANFLNDDIFSGIRHFHSCRILKNFNKNLISMDNYSNHFKTLCLTHLVDNNKIKFKDLQNHLDLMQSNGLQVDFDLIKIFIETMLKSSEFNNSNSNSNSIKIFEKRFSLINSILTRYNPILTYENFKILLPLMIISGSELDNNQIVKSNLACHSNKVNQLNQLLPMIKPGDRLPVEELLIKIYSSSGSWKSVVDVLERSIDRNEIKLVKLAGELGLKNTEEWSDWYGIADLKD